MTVAYDESNDELDEKLNEVKSKFVTRVFCVYTSSEDAPVIFNKVRQAGLITPGSVFIVSEEALASSSVIDGSIGVSLNATRERSYIADTLRVIQSAVNQLLKESSYYTSTGQLEFANLTYPSVNCR